VIVKHSKGIAKIPFYELDDATRSAVGYAGEVEPPIRHSAPPETGLLPDIDGHAVESSDLDLEADPAVTEDEEKDAAAMQSEVRGSPERPVSQPVAVRTAKRIVRQPNPVGVGAVGASSKHGAITVSTRAVGACAVGASHQPAHSSHDGGYRGESDVLFARGAVGRYLLGLPIRDQLTTKHHPYGNYTFEGSSGHWYGYYGKNVCNRRLFDKRDYRRWQR
jgi:hypothetical protein